MLPAKSREYLLTGLSASPIVASKLLSSATNVDYDFRPFSDRFTLREVVSHLADWEDIFFERIVRMVTEDNPTLPDIDEGQAAIDNDYAHMDPLVQLERYHTGRNRLVDYLRTVPDDMWQKPGLRPELGTISVEILAVMILGHDGYHTKQIAEWLDTMGS